MIYLGQDAIGINHIMANPPLEYIKTYVVEESWENDTKGNPITVVNTVMPNLTTDYSSVLILNFKNNQANNNYGYRVDTIIVPWKTSVNNDQGFIIRNNKTASSGINTSTSSWASIGTNIEVYKLHLNQEVTANANE